MNAVEIEEAVSQLASAPFDRAEFPFAFLAAFGNKKTTIDRLRSGASNSSDIPGGVLQRSNIHIATCTTGETERAIEALKLSPKTASAKARFVVATDGVTFQAEDLASDDPPVICDYADFPNHFGFFLPLAGISTVKQIRENAFDVRATGRLNKLYMELRKHNPDWDTPERQHDMNHFMARLIFCFFAEDTDIFNGSKLFTATIDQMSAPDGANVHEIIGQLFRAMNTRWDERKTAGFRPWAEAFPYVNGGLFAGSTETPRFTKLARAFLINIGSLEWRKINPDIFGSMIQAVADDEERGALGMHYTSVPNILKVLNPLFLDDLRARVEEAGDNPRMLLNLRKRMSKIRVFDPACGSGNFLVIAYKEMRAIEAEINRRRDEQDRPTDIPITNFRGIELRDFPAEIARLALIIAEYQCDVLYRGQKEALKEFLPLDSENWITCGNALRLDWLSVCPPTGTGVKLHGDDLFNTPLDQAQIDFENEGGETYVCGNPPYKGGTAQDSSQKEDLRPLFEHKTSAWKSLDYVSGWFLKFSDYASNTKAECAFVTTNSICQGEQVSRLWPLVLSDKLRIHFAYSAFKWNNLAAANAGVSVVIVGLSSLPGRASILFDEDILGKPFRRELPSLNAYLVGGPDIFISAQAKPIKNMPPMTFGSKPVDGGHLILDEDEALRILNNYPISSKLIKRYLGAEEAIKGLRRFCIWITESQKKEALSILPIKERVESVRLFRLGSNKELTRVTAGIPHRFQQVRQGGDEICFIVPRVSSERRSYLPITLQNSGTIVSDSAFALFDPELWCLSLVASRIHLVWIATVCGKLKTDYRYSNTLGWNTFPVPTLTDQNKADLTRCAEDILLAREAHFPATIADLYDPDTMPDNLREAHERNDEVLERIYIGRRFRNDTERLEKLFELYTKMIASAPKDKPARKTAKRA